MNQPQIRTKKYKQLSQRKKNKIWNSERCDLCGKEKENLIHSKTITIKGRTFHVLKKSEKACTRCVSKREEAIREFVNEQLKSE